MLAVADESFFSSSRMAVLTNGLLSFESAAVQIDTDEKLTPIASLVDSYDDSSPLPSKLLLSSSQLSAND